MACFEEQEAANVPVSSRRVVAMKDCTKHSHEVDLHIRNVPWVQLYHDIAPYHRVIAEQQVVMDLPTLDLLCRHRKFDFNVAFRRLTVIHQGLFDGRDLERPRGSDG